MTMTVILMLGEIRVLAELKLLHGQSIIKVVGGIIVWNGTEIELEHCGCESRSIRLFLQRDPRALAIGRPSVVLLTCCNSNLDMCEVQQHVMSPLQYAGRLFSVYTLDARFMTSSKTPPPRIDPARPSPDKVPYNISRKGRAGGEDIAKGASPPRWRSPEFLYHGLVFLVAVPLMFKTVYDVSKRKQCPGFGTTFLSGL